MDRLPDVTGMKSEVVVQRGHRNSYDHAIRAVGRHLRRGRLPRVPGGGRDHALADRGGDHRPHRGRRVPDPRHAGHAEPARGRRDRARQGRTGDRRRGGRASAARQPAPVHRRRSRPRRVLRRQGDRRPAVQRHPRRPRRPDRFRGPAASGHGRAGGDVEQAVADRLGAIGGVPHQGIGRSLKVGREEVVGLLTALERYAAGSDDEDARVWTERLEIVAAALGRGRRRRRHAPVPCRQAHSRRCSSPSTRTASA